MPISSYIFAITLNWRIWGMFLAIFLTYTCTALVLLFIFLKIDFKAVCREFQLKSLKKKKMELNEEDNQLISYTN